MNYSQEQYNNWSKWMFLQDIHGLGAARIKTLHQLAGSIDKIFQLIELNQLNYSWASTLSEDIKSFDLTKYHKVIDDTFENGAQICTLDDDVYPPNLRLSNTSPGVLFYKGSIETVSERSLALVGTLTPTPEGLKRADKFARLCVENQIQVISGLARGIDTASHKAALKYGGKTFAVIGHGIDHCYPAENAELFQQIVSNGAVISQFPTGTKPNQWMFPARNETMCTLSSGTVIIEAHEKCGSIIQAKHSFKHQRRVFLLSANLIDEPEWAIKLIDQGADVVKDFDIVLERMGHVNHEFNKDSKVEEQNLFNTTANASPKAYLFDLDNVLYDSFNFMEKVYLETVRQINNQVTDKNIKIIKEKINNAPTYVFKCIGIDPYKGNDLYKRIYLEHIKQGIDFYPGIENLIKDLSSRGYSIGIVTSQPLGRYTAIMEHADFKSLIKIEVTWNDLKKGEQKPHPAGIIKALGALNVKPNNAVYIGDDIKDIQAAKAAGIRSIAAVWGTANENELVSSNPDFIARKPSDILNFVL